MGTNDQALRGAGGHHRNWARIFGLKGGDGSWRWPHRPEWLRKATDLLLFFGLVLVVALSAVWIAPAEEAICFKIGCVVFFAVLPALIYLQFVAERIDAVWDEYVINLYQLKLDDPSNLPEPPEYSEYHDRWIRKQRKSREDSGATAGRTRTLYQQKFEGLFGPVDNDEKSRLRSQNAAPVALATFILALGWVLVTAPESVWNTSVVIPSSFTLSGLPDFPTATLRFAFLGAYFYVLQMVVRRYFQGDLKSNAFLHATMRVIMSVLLVWTIDPLMADLTQAQRSAIAFVIGVFPLAGWQLLSTLIVIPARTIVPSLKPDHPLDGIEGLNVWYQSRLLELGIEDMQNLATASFVDLMLNTRIPVGRLVDWVDQAILLLHIDSKTDADGGGSDLCKLRRYGIRSATSLEETLQEDGRTDDTGAGELDGLLDRQKGDPSVIRSVVRSIRKERNLKFVRAWKYYGQGGVKVMS